MATVHEVDNTTVNVIAPTKGLLLAAILRFSARWIVIILGMSALSSLVVTNGFRIASGHSYQGQAEFRAVFDRMREAEKSYEHGNDPMLSDAQRAASFQKPITRSPRPY